VMVMAGGTDLLPNMKRNLFEPKHLVGLSQVRDLDYVRTDPDGTVRIGAGTLLATVARHPDLARYPGLRAAAASGSTPHLQNMGTIGGNLCLDTRCTYYDQSFFWRQALGFCLKNGGTVCRVAASSPVCLATHSADTVPAFMVLDAEVSVVGPQGARAVKVGDLYRNDGKDCLRLGRGEILTEVRVPPHEGYRTSYWKLRERESIDFPLVGLAFAVKLVGKRAVEDARVALTGVFSAPTRLGEVEKTLLGKELDEAVIRAAAEAGHKAAHPVDNTTGSIVERRNAVRVFITRALREMAKDPSNEQE
ncbi:MAG: FAD binding domain-containing protein, partial [Chloroflexota bacterium]|nr:FAD binding domain-containing protein [Chloroflexota bacterium]